MTKEDLSKLIDECCDDIFDRKEPLVNVKARLYYTLKKQLTLTDVVVRSEQFTCFNPLKTCSWIQGGIVSVDRKHPCDNCK